MSLFSVICPTMWYGAELKHMLPLLDTHPEVGQIILINNCNENTPKWFSETRWNKVTTISPAKNVYVNPAFNLGVSTSKYEKILLMQDDIFFDPDLLRLISEYVTSENGCIALNACCYNLLKTGWNFTIQSELPESLDFIDTPIHHGGLNVLHWLPCLQFIHKKNWIPIDETLKIHMGESWILASNYKLGKIPKMLMNVKVWASNTNTTTDRMEFRGFRDLPEGVPAIPWIMERIDKIEVCYE